MLKKFMILIILSLPVIPLFSTEKAEETTATEAAVDAATEAAVDAATKAAVEATTVETAEETMIFVLLFLLYPWFILLLINNLR